MRDELPPVVDLTRGTVPPLRGVPGPPALMWPDERPPAEVFTRGTPTLAPLPLELNVDLVMPLVFDRMADWVGRDNDF